MKKVVSFLAVAAVVVMMSSAVFAATTNESYSTKIASVTFASAEALSLDVKLYTWTSGKDFATGYSDSDEVEFISFDLADIPFGNDTPKMSTGTVFAKVSSNLTIQPEGTTVYLYTDNVNETGDYKANASRQDGENKLYSGLVRKGNTSTYKKGDFAPIQLFVRKVSDANNEYKSTLPNFYSTFDYTAGRRNLNDISDTNFATKGAEEKIIGISGAVGGLWCGGNPGGEQWYSGNDDVIIFFGAQFSNVVGNDSYATTAIKFATITE